MKHLIKLLKGSGTLLLLLLLIGVSTGSKAQSPEFFTSNGRKINISHFNKQVNDLMNEVGVPGVSLAVIDHNKIVYYNSYGYKKLSTKEAIDKETIFEACSLSKNFLAFAAYKVADEGKLDLDKPMYQYLDYEPLKHDPRYKLITPRMILSHCSGLENWAGFNIPDTLEIISNPGEKYVYSGEGYQYLARILETILHKSYKEYMAEMVFEPLKLARTYSEYSADGSFPTDYAYGHTAFEKEVDKWKNSYSLPAAGIHTTARDYATLLTAFFDGRQISRGSIKNMLTPVVRLDSKGSIYYGPGFEVYRDANDTIISHGGSYNGFKNLMYYSVVTKSGFVFLTNSDCGKAMARKLSALSVGLNINPYFDIDYYEQYPSNALTLLKIYNEKKADAMFAKIEELKKDGKLGVNSLNELADRFWDEDKAISVRLLKENIMLYPDGSQAYFILGEIQMDLKEFQSAYENLKRAKELNVNEESIDVDLKKCEDELGKLKASR